MNRASLKTMANVETAKIATPAPKGKAVKVTVQSKAKPATGPFAPAVQLTREIVGKKEFNKLRGNAIATHSQVIKNFCGAIGVDQKMAMQVIKLAKTNGHALGFLA